MRRGTTYGFDWIVMGGVRIRRRLLRWLGGSCLLGLVLAVALAMASPSVFPARVAVGDALRLAAVA